MSPRPATSDPLPLLSPATPPAEPRDLDHLGPGYQLRYRDSDQTLELYAPNGRMCLHIVLTPEGPRVELHAASLAVRTDRELAIDCERLDLHAARGLSLRTGGDLDLAAAGDLHTEAFAQRHLARRGDIQLKANDDVQLDGERIFLNSPKPGTLR